MIVMEKISEEIKKWRWAKADMKKELIDKE